MKKKVGFVCVHNSCRSQIAEALAKKFASDYLEVYSAGTEIKDKINPDAVRLIKELYNIDMEKDQRVKLIDEIGKVDYLITMGCNVTCPVLSYSYKKQDWGLEDPSGKSDEEFIKIIKEIEKKVFLLVDEVKKENENN